MGTSRYQETVKPDECALTTEIIGRRIAYPFAVLAKKIGLSANTVTVIAGLSWMASLPLAILAGAVSGGGSRALGLLLWFACGFLWNAGYILDMADGSLARMTGTASRRGFYLDYVFHLLFKPAFLASVGLGLFLSHAGGFIWLLLAVLSIPANWSATASAVEHVLCEEFGKGKLAPDTSDPAAFRKLWLGVTDMNKEGQEKASSLKRFIKTMAAEIFSYYGQFSFFSLAVLVDGILACFSNVVLPVTSICFVLVTTVLALRIPFRVLREYRRIAASDR